MASRGKTYYSATSTTVISITSGNITNAYVCGNNTQLNNSSDAYPYGQAIIYIPKGFGSAPAANAPIGLWAVPMYDGSNYVSPGSTVDATPAAQSGFKSTAGAKFMGSFLCSNSTSGQTLIIPKINLEGFAVAKYIISNDTGVTVNAGAGADELKVIITPWANGLV
jgi:hypothetical protein